jgi:preprotein translocase subunit SecA
MNALLLARPGIVLGNRPENAPARHSWLASQDARIKHAVSTLRHRSFARFGRVIREIDRASGELAGLNDRALDTFLKHLRQRLHAERTNKSLCIQSFALIRLVAERTLGMRLYNEQLFGGWLQLRGLLAEMDTGEGKTLTATLPACTIALTGSPVHVITANDYLVTRDAELMRPIYEALRLSVGTVTESSTPEARRAAYRCDVTYVSNKQIVFDYLRDRQNLAGSAGSLRDRLSPLLGKSSDDSLMRGLCFAIVDEADSVLIDDARTPLVLSQPQSTPMPSTNYTVGLGLARRLTDGSDYVVVQSDKSLVLTPHGERRLREMTQALRGSWSHPRYRSEFVTQALTALHLFTRNEDYVLRDGMVTLVDENTGRSMPDRKLSHGLHQMIEAKEGCDITGQMETLGSISYQRFFRRYFHLAGMTGTAREVSGEFRSVYGIPVVRVPPHRPSRRGVQRLTLHATSSVKHKVLIERIRELHAMGRPVLIGTRSVAESEHISQLLTDGGLANRVLNASQIKDEAEMVARAGERGSITVATNIAGRGTDIPLGPGVAELGGLCVISTQLNDARRIDRQLAGRCGRQGDPGTYQAIVSFEDPLLNDFYPESVRTVLLRMESSNRFLWNGLVPLIARLPQWIREQQHYRRRRAVLRSDEDLEDLLAFSGIDR